MILNRNDLQSAVWIKVKKHLQARIEELRMQNDFQQPEVQTAATRGRIDELKGILALEKAPEEGA